MGMLSQENFAKEFAFLIKLIFCGWCREMQATGESMMPTIQADGSLIVLDKLFASQRVKKDDVVIALSPLNRNRNVCKRVGAVVRFFFFRNFFFSLGPVFIVIIVFASSFRINCTLLFECTLIFLDPWFLFLFFCSVYEHKNF
jgi:hypothetical protein